LWTGKPNIEHLRAPEDRYLIPLAVAWCVFVVVALVLILRAMSYDGDNAASPYSLFLLLPFALIAFYFAYGRFMLRRRIGRQVQYAVTAQRALMHNHRRFMSWELKWVWFDSSPPIKLINGRDGRGELVVGKPQLTHKLFGYGDPGWIFDRLGRKAVSFWNVDDVEEVAKLVEEQG
jgi:hypothetical protein